MTDTMPQVRAGRNAAEVQAACGRVGASGGEAARRVLAEATMTLDAATGEFGRHRGGKPPCLRTVMAWVRSGFRRPDGSRVYLDGVKVGARWVTSREAVARFIVELAG